MSERGYDEVYWRIYLCRDNKYAVVCMQSFDECDYNQDRFLKDKNGDKYIFYNDDDYSGWTSGEQTAKEFLNKVINIEFIHDDDIIANNENMYKIPKEEW